MLITWVVPKLWFFQYLIVCPNLPTKCKLEKSWDLRSHLEAILHITCLIFRNLILRSPNNRPSFWETFILILLQIFHMKFAKFIINAIRQSLKWFKKNLTPLLLVLSPYLLYQNNHHLELYIMPYFSDWSQRKFKSFFLFFRLTLHHLASPVSRAYMHKWCPTNPLSPTSWNCC